MWSDDLDSYAGGSVSTCRVSDAGEVKGDDQIKRDTLFLQVGDWGVRLTTSPP